MKKVYKALRQQEYIYEQFCIVPVRYEDRLAIMQWRNEQIYHLRQDKMLTLQDQDHYFNHVLSKAFELEKPSQILFSFLQDDICIGYGGLVHINWVDRNAEISFIMQTELEHENFDKLWSIYLKLIEKVAFDELNFHKIFTYAFDLRPHLYKTLERNNYIHEATLLDHCYFENEFKDVLIHSKFNDPPKLRFANQGDLELTYRWVICPYVRKYSLNQDFVSFESHRDWFEKKLIEKDSFYYIFQVNQVAVGSVRIQVENGSGLISYLIDPSFHGKGYGKLILEEVEREIKKRKLPIKILYGIVLPENIASVKIFEKLKYSKEINENGFYRFSKEIE